VLGRPRTDEKPESAAFLGRQLQATKGVAVEPGRPRQDRRHRQTAQRLVQGPETVGRVCRLDDDQLLQVDPQPGDGRRIEFPGGIEHDQHPSFPARRPCGRQGQGLRAAAAFRRQPFHQGSPMEAAVRQQSVQVLAAAGERSLLGRQPSPLEEGDLLFQRPYDRLRLLSGDGGERERLVRFLRWSVHASTACARQCTYVPYPRQERKE